MDTIKDRVKQLAVTNGISIPDLEKKCGFGNGTIGKWSVAMPNAVKLSKVAKALNTTMDYLLYGEDEQTKAMSSPGDGFTPGDKILFHALRGCSEEDKIRAAKIIRALRDV